MIARVVALFAGGIPTGWLIAGAVAAALTFTGGVWQSGRNYQSAIDDTTALRLRTEQLQAQIDRKDKELGTVNAIQARDVERATGLEKRNRELQEQIDATPVNNADCLDDAAIRRLFGNGQRPVGKRKP